MSKNWNADDWHLYLSQLLNTRANFPNGMNAVALKISETMDELRVPTLTLLRGRSILDAVQKCVMRYPYFTETEALEIAKAVVACLAEKSR